MLSPDEIKAELDKIFSIQKELVKFLLAALPIMGPDALKLAAQISAMVAAGGADPAAILAALTTLDQINADFDKARAAVQAQQG